MLDITVLIFCYLKHIFIGKVLFTARTNLLLDQQFQRAQDFFLNNKKVHIRLSASLNIIMTSQLKQITIQSWFNNVNLLLAPEHEQAEKPLKTLYSRFVQANVQQSFYQFPKANFFFSYMVFEMVKTP